MVAIFPLQSSKSESKPKLTGLLVNNLTVARNTSTKCWSWKVTIRIQVGTDMTLDMWVTPSWEQDKYCTSEIFRRTEYFSLTSLHLVWLHIDWPVNHRWLKVLSRKQPCLILPSMPSVRHTLSTDNPFRHCIFYQPYRVYGRKTMQKTSWTPPAPYLFATALPRWLLSSTFCFEVIWWPSFLLSTNFHSHLWKDLISRWHVIYHTWPLDLQTTSKDGTFGAEKMEACELPQLKICCYIEFHITHHIVLDKH